MITCRNFVDQLSDFLAGELPNDERDNAQKHLATCPPCQAFTASYQRTVQLVQALPDPPLPPSLIARLRGMLNGAPGSSSASSFAPPG